MDTTRTKRRHVRTCPAPSPLCAKIKGIGASFCNHQEWYVNNVYGDGDGGGDRDGGGDGEGIRSRLVLGA